MQAAHSAAASFNRGGYTQGGSVNSAGSGGGGGGGGGGYNKALGGGAAGGYGPYSSSLPHNSMNTSGNMMPSTTYITSIIIRPP